MKSVVENIPKIKIETVKELVDLIKSKRTVLIADISNIPCSQYQSIGKKLRGKALVRVPKRNLFLRALEEAKVENAKGLKENYQGAVALLFSDFDSYELAAELLKNKSPAKAKPGQIAPEDLEIPAGPTDLVPGPAISELGALGIQIMIKGGKIEIKDTKIVAKKGEAIKQNAAEMLGKLGIQPFKIGFTPISAYDSKDDKLYLEIKIDTEGIKETLLSAYSRALPFAVEVGYTSTETVPLMIQKAAAYERKLIRTINGEPDEIVEVAPVEEVKKEVSPEKKEEKESSAAGLASLF
ncbi:MAG: 50S ribosomal protein L10 [Nanoarchaeota archaeon]|nr:50S ribosomal protein L10 [Nanoarchaeota archaeon]